ncbi:uncharacterized protein FOMMEDRAFT_74796, partial [Fomitiporia mediterranea MF3/22]|uniref:uncharacterized protein n=1 Tax=Fomitiporia mediterranea (strain MF3/22) TaxID=694068 RepID=UPI00044077AC
VQWFKTEASCSYNFQEKQLQQIRFLHYSEPGTFRFLDSNLIIWGVHLILNFSKGCTTDYLLHSVVHHLPEKDLDY